MIKIIPPQWRIEIEKEILYLVVTFGIFYNIFNKKFGKRGLTNAFTPKGPRCVFWQHRKFGQVLVIGDLHILG